MEKKKLDIPDTIPNHIANNIFDQSTNPAEDISNIPEYFPLQPNHNKQKNITSNISNIPKMATNKDKRKKESQAIEKLDNDEDSKKEEEGEEGDEKEKDEDQEREKGNGKEKEKSNVKEKEKGNGKDKKNKKEKNANGEEKEKKADEKDNESNNEAELNNINNKMTKRTHYISEIIKSRGKNPIESNNESKKRKDETGNKQNKRDNERGNETGNNPNKRDNETANKKGNDTDNNPNKGDNETGNKRKTSEQTNSNQSAKKKTSEPTNLNQSPEKKISEQTNANQPSKKTSKKNYTYISLPDTHTGINENEEKVETKKVEDKNLPDNTDNLNNKHCKLVLIYRKRGNEILEHLINIFNNDIKNKNKVSANTFHFRDWADRAINSNIKKQYMQVNEIEEQKLLTSNSAIKNIPVLLFMENEQITASYSLDELIFDEFNLL